MIAQYSMNVFYVIAAKKKKEDLARDQFIFTSFTGEIRFNNNDNNNNGDIVFNLY